MTTPLGATGRLVSRESNIEMFFKENTLRIDAFNKRVSEIVTSVIKNTEVGTEKKLVWQEIMEISEKEMQNFLPLKEENVEILKPLLLAEVTSIFNEAFKEN